MAWEVIETSNAPAAIGPYSQAIKAGQWVFVSGQLGLNPATGKLVGDSFADQAKQALDNLCSILEAVKLSLADVVSVDVFLTDISQFAAFNEIYGGVFSHHKPARAVVEVKGLPRGACVEIKCVACLNE